MSDIKKGKYDGENNPNYNNHKLKGLNNPNAKPVYQYDLEGNFIKTWNSYSECRKEHPNVKQVLTGGRKQTHGYTFKIHK